MPQMDAIMFVFGNISIFILQNVPLATEPGISLIILTPMKTLQRNWNRSTFVVWEMKRNVSVVRLVVATRSRLFRRPRHFEGTLATALPRSDAAWLFLMGIYERESLPKQTTNHGRIESKHHRRNSGSDSGRTGKDFPKYGAPDSILSGRKWWPLPAHVMILSHFLHNEVSPLKISLQ